MRGWKGGRLAVISSFLFLSASSAGAFEVAVVKSAEIKPYLEALEGFKSTCNCVVTELTRDDDQSVPARIERIRPDAVLTIGLDALKKMESVRNVPVFFTMVPYPAARGQGQKTTSGVHMSVPLEKQFDAILAVFPNARRVGIVYDPGHPDFSIAEAFVAAHSRGIDLIARKAQKPGEVFSLIDGLKGAIDVFLLLPDRTVISPETVNHLLLFSFQNRIPVFSFSKKYVEMGAVAALTVDPFDLGAQTGEIMKKALRTGPEEHVVVPARKSVITVNRKVARKLGIEIPADILERAEIVE